MTKQWYIIQVRSGFEFKVKTSLENKIIIEKKSNSFNVILVPSEDIIEIKSGKKKKIRRKIFPGYILVNMEMNDDSWHFIKKIPMVLGFLGDSSFSPRHISNNEFDGILLKVKEFIKKPRAKVLFEIGELVRIKDGPFVDFSGIVEEVNYDKNRLVVSVLIFGRSTPVDLDFSQVEKC